MARQKTMREYEDLFEDLMQYTEFKSSDEIQTRENLFDFFEQVKGDSEKKGRRFIISKLLFSKVAEVIEKVRKPIESKLKKALQSRRVFRHLVDAEKFDLDIVIEGKKIFKSSVKIRGNLIIRWRDTKGRFVKTPVE